jgi:hypothetical protein
MAFDLRYLEPRGIEPALQRLPKTRSTHLAPECRRSAAFIVAYPSLFNQKTQAHFLNPLHESGIYAATLMENRPFRALWSSYSLKSLFTSSPRLPRFQPESSDGEAPAGRQEGKSCAPNRKR